MSYASQFGEIIFGSGIAVLTPYAANGPALPTPLQLPIAQELSIDISADIAELYGQGQFAYGLARTKTKIDCKAKIGAIYQRLLGDLFFGVTSTAGQTLFALQEQDTVTSLTCTVTNAAHFAADCGVINQATGQPYTSVGTAGTLTTVGQYKYTTGGVYTFYTSDTIAVALITYTYTSSSTGFTGTVVNQAMGAMPTFDFKYMNNQFGPNLYLEFYKGIAKKFSLPNKNTEFEMPDFDFSCFSQTNGNCFLISMDE
jgi:hypothetical protein